MSPSRRAQDPAQLVVFAAQNDFLDSGREALCRALLPPEKLEAVLRYRRERDRRQRLLARLLLALALRRLEGWPERLALERLGHEAAGRPYVRGCSWRISFTHAGEWVVCALGKAVGEIGVDVENIRPLDVRDFRQIFSAREWRAILDTPSSERELLRYWTLKEAVLKTRGLGLLATEDEIRAAGSGAEIWMHLPLAPGYWLTVAAQRPWRKLQLERL